MKKKRNTRLLLTLGCYALAALVWLGAAGIRLAMDRARRASGTMETRRLALDDFDWDEGIYFSGLPEWDIMTMNGDPQLGLDIPDGMVVGRVLFYGRTLNHGSGEMRLYYNTAPGQDFSESRVAWARQAGDGVWTFDLWGRRVYGLRLDPGTLGQVYWQIGETVINPGVPAWQFFAPDGLTLFLLLFVPPVAAAAMMELAALVSPWFARRRLERKWQELEGGASGA